METFDSESFVSKLLGMGDLKGLLRNINESIDVEKQQEMIERMGKGKFSLRDMHEQFTTLHPFPEL